MRESLDQIYGCSSGFGGLPTRLWVITRGEICLFACSHDRPLSRNGHALPGSLPSLTYHFEMSILITRLSKLPRVGGTASGQGHVVPSTCARWTCGRKGGGTGGLIGGWRKKERKYGKVMTGSEAQNRPVESPNAMHK